MKEKAAVVTSTSMTVEPRLLPLHLAKFYAARHSVETDDEWHAMMAREFKVACSEGRECSSRFDGSRAYLDHAGFTLEVDRSRAEFSISEPRADELEAVFSDLRLPWGYPTCFFARAHEVRLPPAAMHLVEIASKVWIRMEGRFTSGVRYGWIEIYARPGSPLSQFQRIAHDQWTWFSTMVAEDDEGLPIIRTATGPNGEVLYNPHFASTTGKASPVDRRVQCTQELAVVIKSQPDRRLMTRDEIHTWAKRKWGDDFPKSDIDQCYLRAKTRAGANTWDKGGRPRKDQK